MQKIKAKDHWVQKIEWKQTNGRTDGDDCVTSRANVMDKAVGCYAYGNMFCWL